MSSVLSQEELMILHSHNRKMAAKEQRFTVKKEVPKISDAFNSSFIRKLQKRQQAFIENVSKVVNIDFPTGFDTLDKTIYGITPGHTMVIGSRAHVDKTSFVVNIAKNLTNRSGIAVALVSPEDRAETILHKIICSEVDIESKRLVTGDISSQEYDKIRYAVADVHKSKLAVCENPSITINGIQSFALDTRDRHGSCVLIINSFNSLFNGIKEDYDIIDNRITRLRDFSKRTGIPLIVLCDLSRKISNKGDNYIPQCSDLSYTGSIEQDADTILLLNAHKDDESQVDLIIGKSRHSDRKTIPLKYNNRFFTFREDLNR